MGRINQERFEIDEQKYGSDNVAAKAAVPPTAADTSIIFYTMATENVCDPYPKLNIPGRFFIDTNKSIDDVTIAKIKHDMKFKEFAAITVVDSAVQ